MKVLKHTALAIAVAASTNSYAFFGNDNPAEEYREKATERSLSEFVEIISIDGGKTPHILEFVYDKHAKKLSNLKSSSDARTESIIAFLAPFSSDDETALHNGVIKIINFLNDEYAVRSDRKAAQFFENHPAYNDLTTYASEKNAFKKRKMMKSMITAFKNTSLGEKAVIDFNDDSEYQLEPHYFATEAKYDWSSDLYYARRGALNFNFDTMSKNIEMVEQHIDDNQHLNSSWIRDGEVSEYSGSTPPKLSCISAYSTPDELKDLMPRLGVQTFPDFAPVTAMESMSVYEPFMEFRKEYLGDLLTQLKNASSRERPDIRNEIAKKDKNIEFKLDGVIKSPNSDVKFAYVYPTEIANRLLGNDSTSHCLFNFSFGDDMDKAEQYEEILNTSLVRFTPYVKVVEAFENHIVFKVTRVEIDYTKDTAKLKKNSNQEFVKDDTNWTKLETISADDKPFKSMVVDGLNPMDAAKPIEGKQRDWFIKRVNDKGNSFKYGNWFINLMSGDLTKPETKPVIQIFNNNGRSQDYATLDVIQDGNKVIFKVNASNSKNLPVGRVFTASIDKYNQLELRDGYDTYFDERNDFAFRVKGGDRFAEFNLKRGYNFTSWNEVGL